MLAQIAYKCLQHLFKTELKPDATQLLFMLGEHLLSRLITTSCKISDLAFLDVEGRIAHTLMDLSTLPEAISHPKGMELHITRQEIARIVGCSRELVGRVFKELVHKESISVHGKTIIVFGAR